ncbi:MAG TPA: hypothetical protein VF132_12245, partial [Rudaea sp.]
MSFSASKPLRNVPALILALGVAGVVLPLGAHAATTFTWPNLTPSGPCMSTLQACIDAAAAGDIVQIGIDDVFVTDRYTTVNENISINKSLTLRAASGIDA